MASKASEDKLDLVEKIDITMFFACNNPKTSDGINQIKQLLLKHSGDTSDDFLMSHYKRLWGKLFYFMWMSDRMLDRESTIENISCLIHSCISHQSKILFLDAFFITMNSSSWMLNDQQHMMLVRHCLRQLLFTFVNCDWDLVYIHKFNEVLYNALKSFTFRLTSLRTHLQEIFLEELAKVSGGKIPSEALIIILDSFLHYISELNDLMLIREVTQNVFRNLPSQSLGVEILETKFQAWQKMGKPGKSYNDLELIEGDTADNDSNKMNDNQLDPRAGNVSVEIPRIKFNPKDIAKVLNKYATEVDCTKKCLSEITKLIKLYNRLGDYIQPYKPKDLKLNNQELKRKNSKDLFKMVKKGVKKSKMVNSKKKKSGREVNDHKNCKELKNTSKIVKEHGKIGKCMWKVKKFDNVNTLKKNLNGSWTVQDNNNDDTKTVCTNNDEPTRLVPAGFNVEVSEAPKTLTKIPKKVSMIPNLTVNTSFKKSNSNKRKSRKINHNNSWLVYADNGEPASKKVENSLLRQNI